MNYSLQRKISKHLLCLLFLIPVLDVYHASAQQIIFRKDGTKLEAINLVRISDKSFTYNLATDSAGVLHYINSDRIDSIRHSDGKIEIIAPQIHFIEPDSHAAELLKNRIGTDALPIFYLKLNLFYERLFLNNRLGFKNGFLVSLDPTEYYYGNLYRNARNYFRSGLNYYYLKTDMFDFGIGASVLIGSLGFGDLYNETDYTFEKDYKVRSCVLLNASFGYMINHKFKVAANLEFPVGMRNYLGPSSMQLQTELSINF